MNISFTFKNFEPSDHLRKYAQRRFEKLARFTQRAGHMEMAVVLVVDKFRHRVEVQLTGDGMSFSAVEQSSDMYSSVDMVLDKLETQLKKHTERVKEKRRGSRELDIEIFNYRTEGEGGERVIVGEDKFEPKPMHVDEAAMQLEQRDDEFLVFLNAETEGINVIYRRKNGGFGLIAPGI
jgi:putative sigma-54 modulation protein